MLNERSMSDEIMRMSEELWGRTGGDDCCFVPLQLRLLVYVPTLTILLSLNLQTTPNSLHCYSSLASNLIKPNTLLDFALGASHHIEVRVILRAKSW